MNPPIESRLHAALLACLPDPSLPPIIREAFVEFLSGGDPHSVEYWAEGAGYVAGPERPWQFADHALFWFLYQVRPDYGPPDAPTKVRNNLDKCEALLQSASSP